MRKIIIISVLITTLLTACSKDEKQISGNFVIPGTYEGYNSLNQEQKCKFVISEISTDDYLYMQKNKLIDQNLEFRLSTYYKFEFSYGATGIETSLDFEEYSYSTYGKNNSWFLYEFNIGNISPLFHYEDGKLCPGRFNNAYEVFLPDALFYIPYVN